MPGGHRGQQCQKGLTRIHPFPLADEEEALSRERYSRHLQESDDDLFAIHVPLCKTFQACAVATTK